ncbi:MAG: ferredoxin [Gammaproteobacteria bacterium]|uniref:Ferredoxin n=1 Tax=Candidatus Thiopontia autotrophica TaxID=2841688 RepID=A0A8J6NYT2_9GAMM|nr:ferredoxin [Candidatus Thiopontia autotrophica]MBL6968665.1 ferredoxin [Gammaproteobacteria bacterium]
MSSAHSLPILNSTQSEPESETKTLRTLHHFHLGDPSVERETRQIGSDYLPALLGPFRDVSKISYDYPLVLFSRESRQSSQYALPLSTFLQESVAEFAPGENGARILKDNLGWLEHAIRGELEGHDGPLQLFPAVNRSVEALLQHLSLSGDNQKAVENDLEQLKGFFSEADQLLPYDRYTAIHLMIHLVHGRSEERWDQFEIELQDLRRQLNQILDIEQRKSGEAMGASALQKSVGSNANRFNSEALSSVLPQNSGTVTMSEARKDRITHAAEIINQFQRDPVQVRFIHTGDFSGPWADHPNHFETTVDADPCHKATSIFDSEANELAELFTACRIARLEIDNSYDATVHDPWFANFNWEAFSKEELLLVPATVALEPANRLAREGLSSFSQLLGSGRPIQILTRVKGHSNPAASEEESPFHDFRLELGYIATAHRQCYVAQTSAARYQHLMSSFLEATEIPHTGVHLINTGVQITSNLQEDDPHMIDPSIQKSRKQFLMDPWMVASAALEGRVHPFFRMNPELGDTFAERMNFSVNPQPEKDWAIHPFSYQNENGEVTHTEFAFTFADYALLVPKLRNHFRLIPGNFESEALTPIAEYLQQSEENSFSLVPFVWTINKDNLLHRAVVSRELVLACKDRLNYWHTLQELSGVRNPHADQAVNEANLLMEAKQNSIISELQQSHAEEISQLQADATATVMSKLAKVLMGMNLEQNIVAGAGSTATTATTTETEEQDSEPTEEAVEEMASEEEPVIEISEDPWIESILCTTCNDCTNMNPQMFVYNDDKQAYIADPNAGTYAELVEAAEICPSRCIHPGMPLNSSEPDLDELIERAAPFNQG